MMTSVQSIDAHDHARVHVGNNSTTIYSYANPTSDRCLADLRLADPREEKARIEQTKGGLFRDAYKWVLGNDEFCRWRTDNQNRVLWIKGDAGKGKTMLLCGMIDELSQQRPSSDIKQGKGIKAVIKSLLPRRLPISLPSQGPLSFFFCQATDARLNTDVAVLRGLIYHLLIQRPSLIKHLRETYEHGGGKQVFEGSGAFFSLSQAMLGMLRDPDARGIYMMVDALDECETGLPRLLDFIVKTTSVSNTVKWIVSSRARLDIEQALKLDDSKIRLSLELNAEHVTEAVNCYIDYKVSLLVSLKEQQSLRDRVRHEMLRKSNGTFLWAALVLQELEAVQSWDMLRVLDDMPPGLVPLYNRMVKKVEQLNPNDKEICRLLLSTATLAYRPLQLLELGLVSGLRKDIASDIRSVERAIDMCGSFLTVRNSYVYLIHQSAKDFLLDSALKPIFSLELEAIHSEILSTSLAAMSTTLRYDMYHLSHPGTAIDHVIPPSPDPLAAVRYACVYWVDHLLDALVDEDKSNNAKDSLQDEHTVHTFLSQKYLHWLETLSLVRAMPEGVLAIERLHGLLQVCLRHSRTFIISHTLTK
jgi:hypothetical protein